MDFDIEFIREMIHDDKINSTKHFIYRMKSRNIRFIDVKNCIKYGEIIKSYLHDKPDPSYLIFGLDVNGEYLHVVVAANIKEITFITAYRPDNDTFEDDFKTRKR